MSINPTYAKFVDLIGKNKLPEAQQYLIENNIDINCRLTQYDRITVYYAYNSNIKIIKYLLEENCGNTLAFLNTLKLNEYIEKVDKLINPSIYRKITKGLLLKQKPKILKSVNQVNLLNPEIIYQNSFIHACGQGALEIADYTIDKAKNIHAYDNLALTLACKNNQLNSVKYLIDKGFEVSDKLLLCSARKASYYYMVEKYPDEKEDYNVLAYLLNNYTFKHITTYYEKIIENLVKDFSGKYPRRDTYNNVYEVIRALVVIHNVPYTDRIQELLKSESELINLFEKRAMWHKLNNKITKLNTIKENTKKI